MGCEIELKAHLKNEEVDAVIEKLKSLDNSKYLGPIDKYDVYWSDDENGEPIFRTRLENGNDGARVLFTQKPMKSKDYCTEYNVENEFEASAAEWDKIQLFCHSAGLKICRIKCKTGHHFSVICNGFELHCEILNIKYLGWFIETEICGEDLDKMDIEGAEKALYYLLGMINVSFEAVEPKGYNKMLKEIGRDKG